MQKVLVVALFLTLPLAFSRDSRILDSLKLLSEADRLALLYNWPDAARRYAEAEALFQQAGDEKNALSARLGYFWATADTGVSQTIRNEAGSLFRHPLLQADSRLRLRGLVAEAVLARNSNEISARNIWEEILKLAKALGEKTWEDRAKAELGQILYMDGDLQAATNMFREAMVSQYLRLDLGAVIYYTAMVGNGFATAGRPETGLWYCDIALRVARFVNDAGFPFLAYQGKARALTALNRNREAEDIVREALIHARKEQNYFALSQLLVVAGIATRASEPAMAIRYLKEAVDVSRDNGFQHVFAWSMFELAHVYRDIGNFDDAELFSSQSIKVMRELQDRYHLPQHLTLLASLKARKSDFEEADLLYAETVDVIEALLVNVNSRQLKSSLISTLNDAYVGYFELAGVKLSNVEKAYEIVEQSRGRSLADTLRGESEMLSDDEVTVEATKTINEIQMTLLHETSRPRREVLLDQLFAAEQLLLRVRNTSPLMDSTARSKPVPLRTLQAALGSDEMLLEYVLGEDESYLLQITRTDAVVVVLPVGRKRIDDLVEEYRAAVGARQPESTVARELFSLLLRPIIDRQSKARLVVIPDGVLHLLPFDGLTDEQERYVLETHVVTYAPSATVFYLLRTSRVSERAATRFLGVGDVIRSGPVVVSAMADGRSAETALTLSRLPGSREEVTSVAGIFDGPAEVLLEGNATEAAFKAMPLSEYRILHLALHGVANTEFPDRAALVFGDPPTSGQDGLLQAREIRDLPLKADLVVLSACDTGSGRLLGQEGIASLERSFLLAGAKAVIASLWTADDTYTIPLMKRMYQHLVDGYDKGAALRQAKLDVLHQFAGQAFPAYWAGFTLVGEGQLPFSN